MQMLFDGSEVALIDADPATSACVAPTLLGHRDPGQATTLHEVEVFGPVALVYQLPPLLGAIAPSALFIGIAVYLMQKRG